MSSEQKPPVLTREPEKGVLVFFSYAQRDKWLRDELEKHLSNLKYRGLITTWHDQEIRAGEEWAQQIDIYLNKANIILLLISADFMASEHCYDKIMMRALERHEQQEANAIPVLLRPVLFTDAPFAKLQMLPTNRKPIVEWQNRDSAFVDIAYGIEKIAKKNVPRQPFLVPGFENQELVQADISALTGRVMSSLDRPASQSASEVDPVKIPSSNASRYRNSRVAKIVGSNILKIIRDNLLSPLPIGIFVVGLIITGMLALFLHPNLIFLAIVCGYSLLAACIVAALKVIGFLRTKSKRPTDRALRSGPEEDTFYEGAIEDILTVICENVVVDDQIGQESSESLGILTYYEDVMEAYHSALLRNPSDGEAFLGMGNALYVLGRYDEALNAFQQAVDYDSMPTAYAGLANAFAKLKRYSEAIAAYEKAIELDSTVTFNYDDLIQSLLALGRSEEAEQVRATAKQIGYYEV